MEHTNMRNKIQEGLQNHINEGGIAFDDIARDVYNKFKQSVNWEKQSIKYMKDMDLENHEIEVVLDMLHSEDYYDDGEFGEYPIPDEIDELQEATPLYTKWNEYVKPDYVQLVLKDGKKMNIRSKSGRSTDKMYQLILFALDNNNFTFINNVITGLLKRDSDTSNPLVSTLVNENKYLLTEAIVDPWVIISDILEDCHSIRRGLLDNIIKKSIYPDQSTGDTVKKAYGLAKELEGLLNVILPKYLDMPLIDDK